MGVQDSSPAKVKEILISVHFILWKVHSLRSTTTKLNVQLANHTALVQQLQNTIQQIQTTQGNIGWIYNTSGKLKASILAKYTNWKYTCNSKYSPCCVVKLIHGDFYVTLEYILIPIYLLFLCRTRLNVRKVGTSSLQCKWNGIGIHG